MSWASGGANPFDELINPPVQQRAPQRKTQLDSIDAFSSMGFGTQSPAGSRQKSEAQANSSAEKRLSDNGRRLFNSFGSGRDSELLVPMNQQPTVLQPERSHVSPAEAGISFDPYFKQNSGNPDTYGKRPSMTAFNSPSPAAALSGPTSVAFGALDPALAQYGGGVNNHISFTATKPGSNSFPEDPFNPPKIKPRLSGFAPMEKDPFAAPPTVPPSDPFASASDDPFANDYHGDPFVSSIPSNEAQGGDDVDTFLQEEISREIVSDAMNPPESQNLSREKEVNGKENSGEETSKGNSEQKNDANEGSCLARITRKEMLTKDWKPIFWVLELTTSTLFIYKSRDDYYYQPKGKNIKKAIKLKETVACSEITRKEYKGTGALYHFTLEEAGSALGRFAVAGEHEEQSSELKTLRDQIIGVVGDMVRAAEASAMPATGTIDSDGGYEAIPKSKNRKSSVALGDWTNLDG